MKKINILAILTFVVVEMTSNSWAASDSIGYSMTAEIEELTIKLEAARLATNSALELAADPLFFDGAGAVINELNLSKRIINLRGYEHLISKIMGRCNTIETLLIKFTVQNLEVEPIVNSTNLKTEIETLRLLLDAS